MKQDFFRAVERGDDLSRFFGSDRFEIRWLSELADFGPHGVAALAAALIWGSACPPGKKAAEAPSMRSLWHRSEMAKSIRRAASMCISMVCLTKDSLEMLLTFLADQRGVGRALRSGVQDWQDTWKGLSWPEDEGLIRKFHLRCP